jgi:hypothetical protein
MGYLSNRYLQDEYQMDQQKPMAMQKQAPQEPSAAQQVTQTAALASGNPYLAAAQVGGSYLEGYLNRQAQAAEAQKQAQLQTIQQQRQGEASGLHTLGDYWKSALLK